MNAIEIFNFTKGRLHLKCKQEPFERLLHEVDLPEFGEEAPDPSRGYGTGERVYRRNIRISTSISCKRDIWHAIGRQGWRIEGDGGLERYRFLRRTLVDLETAHPPEAALAVLASNEGKRPKKHDAYKMLGGSFKTMDAVMAVIDEHLGNEVKLRSRAWRAEEVALEDFVARNPLLAQLEGTCLDPEFVGREKPDAKDLGRAELMDSSDLRHLTGVLLLAAPGRLAERSASDALRLVEHLDEAASAKEPALGTGLVERLRAVCVEDVRRLTREHRRALIDTYGAMRTLIRSFCDELPAERRSAFERFVPPTVPNDVAAYGNSDDLAEARVERRRVTAEPISLNRDQILASAELVFRQVDRLVDKSVATKKVVREALRRGDAVNFPVAVSDTWSVVRPSGEGVGNGRQTIRLLIDTAANLWFQCAEAEEAAGMPLGERRAWHWISAEQRDLLRPEPWGGRTQVNGDKWDDGLASELKVVYVGTHAAGAGGEVAEPEWVELFRSRLFDRDQHASPDELRVRAVLEETLGADPMQFPSPGMVFDGQRAAKSLTRAYRRLVSRERFVFADEEFRHALAVGRCVLRPELKRGMRIGESSQARADAGAFSFRKFDGKIYYYLSAIPKMQGVRYRRMVIDGITVRAFERVRVIAVERWFELEGTIPVRVFHDPDRRNVPLARYLLGNANDTFNHSQLNLYLRLLTFGFVNSTSHSYKYGFAAMLKDARAPEAILNRACNHALGSPVSEDYARFASDHSVDVFIAEQQQESVKRELAWTLLER